MSFIQRLDGTMIDLDVLGIRTRDFIVNSPSPVHVTETVEGRPGVLDFGSTIGAREILVLFRVVATDSIDFALRRDEIFNLFRSDEPFYLIERRNPGKRWLVKTESTYSIPQRFVYGNFDIGFIAHKGVSESIGTSLNPYEWDVDLWQWGQGVPFEDTKYEYDRSRFSINNTGNVRIDPRYTDLLITVKAIADSFIEIKNKTTGDRYRYDGKLTASDILRLDGVRSTKNSLSVFRNTNKKLISLAPGVNEFEINGAVIESVSFDFRFYYN